MPAKQRCTKLSKSHINIHGHMLTLRKYLNNISITQADRFPMRATLKLFNLKLTKTPAKPGHATSMAYVWTGIYQQIYMLQRIKDFLDMLSTSCVQSISNAGKYGSSTSKLTVYQTTSPSRILPKLSKQLDDGNDLGFLLPHKTLPPPIFHLTACCWSLWKIYMLTT